MLIPSAKLIVDPNTGFTEELTDTPRGWIGQRNYRVNTDDTEEAMLCPELPKRGEKWSAKLPFLVVHSRGPNVRMGGKPNSTETANGWTRVPVYYQTVTFGGLQTPQPGESHDAWTAWAPSVGTQRVYQSLERFYEDTGVVEGPIDNGNGADIFVGQYEARVTAFYPLTAALPIGQWVELSEKATLNDAPMELPRVYGSERRLRFERGQVLYTGPGAIEAVGSWLRAEHVLKVAGSWDKQWEVEDAKGNRTNRLVRDRLYEYANLSGIWQTR